ncbi:MAG: TonB-dependent receptor [Odoribacter sp.]|nr:TonB-dependent receptor [Odoribacter sp.]
MKKLFLLLVAVLSISLCASAQTQTIKGTVLDASNDEPLIGASVTATGETLGVTTDADGDFTIVIPASAKQLTVSYIGYTTQNVAITGSKLIIRLQSTSVGLDEVMAVAYGTVKKAEYTGSASVVKADQLQDVLVSNVTNALSGKMSGVMTQSSTGQPGESASVIIRGVGSINTSSTPLYVVDGMPFSGDIAAIPTTDIEAITVLKDAASTALYGERGANGVILVTTKRGSEGSARVTVDMRWGSNSRMLPNYDVISDTRQYLETYYQAIYNSKRYFEGQEHAPAAAYANSAVFPNLGYQTFSLPAGQTFFDTNGKFNPNATPGYVRGNYYFTVDDITKAALANGLRQEYNMSVSGGNDRFNYYVSGSYLGDEGIIEGSDFKRFSSRASVDYKVNNWFKIGTSMMYTYYDTGNPDDQGNDGATTVNTFYFINGIAPVYPYFVRSADGQILRDKELGNKPVYDFGDGHDYGLGLLGATRAQSGNPTGNLAYDTNRYYADIFDGKWYAQLTPISGLVITGNAGLYINNTRYHSLSNPFYGQTSTQGGSVYQIASRLRVLTFQAMADYTKTFNDIHTIAVMLGYENEDLNSENIQAIGYNLYQPFVPVVDNTSDRKNGYGSISSLVHRAIIARARYNLYERYFLTASVRRGASSRFAPDHRWGTFFSVSAGWDIAKENFMQQFADNVDMLKFKASFGQNGNDLIGANYIAYADQYQISGSEGVWSDGSLYYKGNPDITWEKSNAFNIGFDFSFWKGMLSGTVEYYNRQTSDMLFNIPVAPSLGYSSLPMNIGSMRNNGVEIDLNYRPINTRNITWDIFANATFQGNKVLKLAPQILTHEDEFNADFWKYSTTRWFKEGESMYQYYLVEDAGIVHNQEELDEIVAAGGVGELGGRLFWAKDKDGNFYKTGEYNDALNSHRKATGSLLPKVYGGFGTTLKLYGFDVSATFSYQLGGRLIDYGYNNLMQNGTNVGMNIHVDQLNAWTMENQNTDIPALYTNQKYSNAQAITEDRFIISSNYLSLNNVTVGYTLPASVTSKLKLASVRLYFSGENLALWSRRKGLDPRQGFASSENYTYSPIRSLSGGINVSF